MRSKFGLLLLVVGLGISVVACGSVPQAAIDAAKAAVDQAVTAGANEYAADAMKAAQDAQAALDAELKVQEGKWFKSYTQATELAAALKTAGEQAVTAAAAGKEKVKGEATGLIAEVKTALEEAQTLLAKAPKGKGTAADIEALKTDLANAATALTDAESGLTAERFLDAKAKAESAKNAVAAVKTAVETAMAAKKR